MVKYAASTACVIVLKMGEKGREEWRGKGTDDGDII
jgi:hypothetical protein